MVTVTPRDADRYAIKMQRAIELLQVGQKIEQFNQQFQLLQNILADWLRQRDDILGAYITFRDGLLAFVVVRNVVRYDEQFEDSLSELDMSIANDVDLDLIRLRTISLPCVSDDALTSFLDSSFSLSLPHGQGQGQGAGSHSTGQQKPRRSDVSHSRSSKVS
jgi:hypothetical protein